MMSDVLRWVVPVPLALAVLIMQPPTQTVAKATTTELDSGRSTAKAINPGEVRVAGQRKFGGTSNSGTPSAGTRSAGTRSAGTNSSQGTGRRFVDNRFSKRTVSGGSSSSESGTSKSGSGRFSTRKAAGTNQENTNKENVGQTGTGKIGSAGASKMRTGTNSTSGTNGKNATGPAGKTGSDSSGTGTSGSNGGTSSKIGMGPAGKTGSGGSGTGQIGPSGAGTGSSASNGGTNGKIGMGPAMTGSGANTLTSTRAQIRTPGTPGDLCSGVGAPKSCFLNQGKGVGGTGGSAAALGAKTTTDIGSPVLVPTTAPAIPSSSKGANNTTACQLNPTSGACASNTTPTGGGTGSGGTNPNTANGAAPANNPGGGTTTKGGGTTTAGGTTTTGGATPAGGGGKTGKGGKGGNGGQGGIGPVAGVMGGMGGGPVTNSTPINNQSVTIFRGPRHVWIGGVERSFVAAGVLPGLYLGSDYYAPQGYIAVAHPACYGKTVEGCLLRWQQVPLESGGSDVQCVQLCRSSGGGLAQGPAAQQIAAAAQALAAEPMAPAPAQAQTAGGCEVAIYADADFAGQATSTVENQPRLGDVGWKGEIASVQVKGGTWDFFSDDDYGGQTMRLPPGEYTQLGPQWTKQISSFMCLGQQ